MEEEKGKNITNSIGLTIDQAIEIALEAKQLLQLRGKKASIHICNEQGTHLVSLTLPGTKGASISIARYKAEESAKTGRSTRQNRDERIWPDLFGLERLVGYAGGLPIYDMEKNLLGAIGISGLSEEEDECFAADAVKHTGYKVTK